MQACYFFVVTLLALGVCRRTSKCRRPPRFVDALDTGFDKPSRRFSELLLALSPARQHRQHRQKQQRRMLPELSAEELDRSIHLDLEDAEHNQGELGNESNVVPVMLLPCCYIPSARGVLLNFIEPRMKRMCQSTKRFLVSFVNTTKRNICSRVGVMFEIQKLTEVKGNLVITKFLAVSNVLPQPFQINRVLNGNDHSNEEEFLQADVQPFQDTTTHESPKVEAWNIFADIQEMGSLYWKLGLNEPPGYNLSVIDEWLMQPSDEKLFWPVVERFQRICEYTIRQTINSMNDEINGYIFDYLDRKGGVLNLPVKPKRDLPPNEYANVQKIEARWRSDLEAMNMNPNAPFQLIIETPSLTQRAQMLQGMTDSAVARLRTMYELKKLLPEE